MADSQIKLYYFDGKGRVEAARLILVAAGKQFEDIRFVYPDGWSKYKHLSPFGQCPLLEIDGQKFAQSLAIKTFLARKFGFHGQTNLESLQIDQVSQLVEDFTNISLKAMSAGDEATKKEAVAKVIAEDSPRFHGYFEKLLKENGTGYFVGNRLTLADIVVFDLATGMIDSTFDINDSFPLLKKNVETVRAHSKIGPYVASRAPTPF
jgi:glutathione S-transferase